MNAETPVFDPEAIDGAGFLVALEGYEGPLHLLLALARAQKVDIGRLSVSALADQYLDFVAAAARDRIDLAADYLVMAAWLAYLKSRLLAAKPEAPETPPSEDELAMALRRRLERLAAARAAAERLFALPQMGRDVFAFGRAQSIAFSSIPDWRCSLHTLLATYGAHAYKAGPRVHAVPPRRAYPLDEARKRLESVLETAVSDWLDLETLAPAAAPGEGAHAPQSYRASLLGAALELARDGRLELRQAAPFAPLFVKAAS